MNFPERISLLGKSRIKIENWYKQQTMQNFKNTRIADFFSSCVKHHSLKIRKLRFALLPFLNNDVDSFLSDLISFIENLPMMTPEEKEIEKQQEKERKKLKKSKHKHISKSSKEDDKDTTSDDYDEKKNKHKSKKRKSKHKKKNKHTRSSSAESDDNESVSYSDSSSNSYSSSSGSSSESSKKKHKRKRFQPQLSPSGQYISDISTTRSSMKNEPLFESDSDYELPQNIICSFHF